MYIEDSVTNLIRLLTNLVYPSGKPVYGAPAEVSFHTN